MFSYEYLTFEEVVLEFATDVVIAQFIGQRPFGNNLTEFEFAVQDRVLGNAADRIFIYAERTHAHVTGTEREVAFEPGVLSFEAGIDYLLPLIRITSPYANTHEDGFTFIRNFIVINLDAPSDSVMYSEPLALHATGLDFNARTLESEQILTYVAELTADNSPAIEPIRSELLQDIIHESPYILLVEINEPLRLSRQQATTDWMRTDIYYVTVIQSLKGDYTTSEEGDFVVIFFADTVSPGEQHIVAVRPIDEGNYWHRFTSRNSLFSVDQMNEILSLLSYD